MKKKNDAVLFVAGNPLEVALPLESLVRTLDGSEEVIVVEDFYPNPNYDVNVVLSSDTTGTFKFKAVMEGNVATFSDTEEDRVPVGLYNITITCRDNRNQPRRFHKKDGIEVVDATIEANIPESVDYDMLPILMERSVYFYAKGDPGFTPEEAQQMWDDFNSAQQQRAADFNASQEARDTAFEASEAQRSSTFNENERQRSSTFTTNEANRSTTFSENEAQRTSTFTTNEASRSTTFAENEATRQAGERERNAAEQRRQSTFLEDEAARQQTFITNEAARQQAETLRAQAESNREAAETAREQASATAVGAANDAAASARTSAGVADTSAAAANTAAQAATQAATLYGRVPKSLTADFADNADTVQFINVYGAIHLTRVLGRNVASVKLSYGNVVKENHALGDLNIAVADGDVVSVTVIKDTDGSAAVVTLKFAID